MLLDLPSLFRSGRAGALLTGVCLILGSTARGQESWSPVVSPTVQNLWSAIWGRDSFAAVGENGTILTSPDGITWTPRIGGTARWLVGVGYGNGLFVIVGDQGTLLTSPDGAIWTARTSGTTARLNGVAFGGGHWLAVAESGEVLSSTDGLAWTRLQPSSDRLRGLTYAYGQFVITGDNGLMRTTIDTIDYDARILPEGLFVESVVNARRLFVAVGEGGYIIRSADTVTWSRVASGTLAYLRGVTHYNNQFIVVGSEGTILTSADPAGGWTRRAIGSSPLLTAVAAGTPGAIAVGFGGTVLRSVAAPAAPTIVTPPRTIAEAVGSNVLFEVAAIGSPPLTYQWTFNGVPLAGQTTDRLIVTSVQAAQAGAYAVTVANPLGTATSGPAMLGIITSTASTPIVDPTFAPTLTYTGPIAAVVEQPDGRIIVGGSQFFVTPGISPLPLVRLNGDGSLDSAFSAGSFNNGATVSTLALQSDGRILVGGNFNTFNGTARLNLLRLNSDGTLDPGFNPPAAAAPAALLELSVQRDGKVLVLANTVLRRLNADGTLDVAFTATPSDMEVRNHALLPDNRILVSAYLPTRILPARLYRFGSDGMLDPTFPAFTGVAPVVGPFGFLAPTSDGKIYAASGLLSLTLIRLDRVNADGSADSTWPGIPALSPSVGSSSAAVFAFAPSGRILHSATYTGSRQPTVHVLRRFSANGSVDFSLDPRSGPNGRIAGLVPLRDERTIAFGDFTTFDGVSRPKLVRLVAANAPEIRPPVIVSVSPETLALRPGEPARITVLAAGSGPLTYSTTLGTVIADAAGTATLTIPTALSGSYRATVTATNRAGSATSVPIRLVVAPSAPVLIAPPAAVTVRPGRTAILTVEAGGSAPFTYEWFRGATRVDTSPTLRIDHVSIADAGDYRVVVRNSLGVATSQTVRLTVDVSARLANLSTRASVAAGEQVLIAGFVIQGAGRKNLVVRGAGPALAALSLTGLLPNPVLTLYDSAGRAVATNDNWSATETPASLFAQLGGFPFGAASLDSALRVTLDPGSYTLHLTDSANRSGLALAEIYENDGDPARLANLSSRALVGPGAALAISGLVVQGQQPGRFLIRAVGPGLADFGVRGTLADPVLRLTTAVGVVVSANDDWSANENAAEISTTSGRVGAFPLPPGSRDAALLVALAPGNYTAQVSGANDGSGVALIEVYEVP